MAMDSKLSVLFTVTLAACAAAPTPTGTGAKATPPPAALNSAAAPPVAKRVAHIERLHGADRADDYYWLRQKDTPDVLAYLHAENAYTDSVMRSTSSLQETLYREMRSRLKETDLSVPFRKGGFFYYTRNEQGLQYPILCRRSAVGADPEDLIGATARGTELVLLDLNEIGKQSAFVGMGSHAVSDDGSTFAYAIDTTGFRENLLRFKDLGNGTVFPEAIPHVEYVAFAKDNRTVFYVVEEPKSKRPYRMYRHRIGSDPATDALVYEEKDESYILVLERARSGEYLFSVSISLTTTEVRYQRSDRPADPWQILEPRQHGHRYFAEHRGDLFYIRTDSPATAGGPKSRNYRLVTAEVKNPGRTHWKELIPHREDVMLEDVVLFSSFVVVRERVDALPRLRVFPLAASGMTSEPEIVQFSEAVFALSEDENPDFHSPAFRFHYQSPVTPDSVYDYDVKQKRLLLRKRREVLGGYDPEQYQTARIHAVSSDGIKIPISLVYRKGLHPDHSHPNPMLLIGYGSYGIPLETGFAPQRISLLDRGVMIAMAHIRGGGDLGKHWHEDGRMAHKMNTFTDFIASAEALVQKGYTAPDRLVIQGRSAGGLLMGAVTNLRPDLFKGVVTEMPFVDVINTMLDESIPLTVGEFEEWGNPKKKEEFDTMIRYSPYDNLAKKAYPAMLVMTAYNDSQVMYWEPAKYVAKLRALKTDPNPLLLRTHMEPSGHAGRSGRYDRLHELAFVYSFMLAQLGIWQ